MSNILKISYLGQKLKGVSLLLGICLGCSSCAVSEDTAGNTGAGTGAVVGGVLGNLIGGNNGDRSGGTAVGAFIGTGLGDMLGRKSTSLKGLKKTDVPSN